MKGSISTGAVCATVAALVYSNTFNAEFVYDDNRAIISNPDVVQTTPISHLFINDFWGTPLSHSGSHHSYRPLTVLTFRLTHALFGLNPCAYHVTNVFLHALTTFLLCHVISSVLRLTNAKVLLAGLIFALHPIHTEAVAGIVGRADVMATLFFLGTLLCYHKATGETSHAGGIPLPATGSLLPRSKVQTLTHRNKTLKGKRKRKSGKRNNRQIWRECTIGERSHTAISSSLQMEYYKTDLEPFKVEKATESDDSHTTADTYDSISSSSSIISEEDATASLFSEIKPPNSELKRRQCMDNANNNVSTEGCTQGFSTEVDFSGREVLFLALSFVLATASLLSKEPGYCALPVCVVYDLWIRHRLGIFGALKAILSKDPKWRSLRIRIFSSFFFTTFLITTRIMLPIILSEGKSRVPGFSPSDNPAAACENFRSRALTFTYLLAVNAAMLVFPVRQSFDWSMGSVPIVENFSDPRNSCTLAFFATFLWLVKVVWDHLRKLDVGDDVRIDDDHNNLRRYSSASSCDEEHSMEQKTSKDLFPVVEVKVHHLTHSDSLSSAASITILIFSLITMLFSFLPASNLFFYVGFVIAERVLYLPSIGSTLLITQAIFLTRDYMRRRYPNLGSHHFVFKSVLFCALACLASRTWTRNYAWKNELSLYSSGIDVNPAKAWANLGNVYRSQELRHKAEEAYVAALRHRPNMADVHYNLGVLYQEEKRYREAEQRYIDAIKYRPKLVLAHLNLGVTLSEQGRKQEAKKVYEQAALIDDEDVRDPRAHSRGRTSSLYNLGCLLADEGRHVEAVSAYQRALKMRPIGYQTHSLLNMLGQSFFHLGRYEEAELTFDQSLSAKPDHVLTHLTYARLLNHVGRFDQSERLYKAALDLDPDHLSTYQHYGNFLTARGRHGDAARLMTQAVASSHGSRDYEVVMNAANAYRQAKSYSEAEKYYRMATQISPQFASAHMNLGAILHLRGKYTEAKSSYVTALSIKPDDVMIKENLGKLEKIMKNLDKK
uniref:dolichyl-phosphate-mannose--protein mannosyltransferase n=1 Tax=Phallusia mammillata TaxID=59560 RepID=A0A6F9DVH3_9ASCI|nr:transmembrane and TPR repeat-containing protein 2-like [Phallusia mammillata]